MEQRDAERKAATEIGMLFLFSPDMTTHKCKNVNFSMNHVHFSRPWAISDIIRDPKTDPIALILPLFMKYF